MSLATLIQPEPGSASSTRPQKVSMINLGCAKNEVDAEEMLGELASAGYAVETSHNPAGVSADTDVVVINTCAFIDAAKEESINTILEALQRKERGEIKKVIVAGCLVQRYAKELAAEMPQVDAFLGTGQMGQIRDAVGQSLIRMDQLLDVAAKPHHRFLQSESRRIQGISMRAWIRKNVMLPYRLVYHAPVPRSLRGGSALKPRIAIRAVAGIFLCARGFLLAPYMG